MTHKNTALTTAVFFFVIWLSILYAGADHPPPSGFILVIIFDLVASLIIYFRVPVYIEWQITHKTNRLLQVGLEGFLAGIVIALITALTSSGEPSVTLTPIDKIIWFAVLGIVGAINAVLVNYFSIFISKVFTKFNRNT